MPILRKGYKCKYCNTYNDKKDAFNKIKEHEDTCRFNKVNKQCITCNNYIHLYAVPDCRLRGKSGVYVKEINDHIYKESEDKMTPCKYWEDNLW